LFPGQSPQLSSSSKKGLSASSSTSGGQAALLSEEIPKTQNKDRVDKTKEDHSVKLETGCQTKSDNETNFDDVPYNLTKRNVEQATGTLRHGAPDPQHTQSHPSAQVTSGNGNLCGVQGQKTGSSDPPRSPKQQHINRSNKSPNIETESRRDTGNEASGVTANPDNGDADRESSQGPQKDGPDVNSVNTVHASTPDGAQQQGNGHRHLKGGI